MEEILKLFHQDIESIFEIAKEKYNYDGFTVTLKKLFDPTLEELLNVSKESIAPYIYETELAVGMLTTIQEYTEKLMFFYKVNDESFKSRIYNMSPCYEIDSHLAFNFNEKNWHTITKFE